MQSLLGACALEQDNVEKALEHYQRSWEFSRHAINQFFAGAGLLSCHGRKHERDPFYGVVRRLLDLAKDGVPEVCAEDLVKALKTCPVDLVNEEVEQLLEAAQQGLGMRPDSE